jgi:hypothetical protein
MIFVSNNRVGDISRSQPGSHSDSKMIKEAIVIRRFVGCQLGLAVVVCGLAGCGGGDMEGMPQDTATHVVPVMPDAMKGANFKKTPEAAPKAAPAQ